MKKYLLLLGLVVVLAACGHDELNEINERVTEKKDEKKDPNFLIFNDHYKKGKGEIK